MELKQRKKNQIKYTSVRFGGGRLYTFKTILNLDPGDKVVVRTAQGLGSADVYATNIPFPNNDFEYNWIVGKIDLKKFDSDFIKSIEYLGIKLTDK